jgi:phosphopantothenoylcysteine decarboxylase/phosphopantothenate--cysteine ligase
VNCIVTAGPTYEALDEVRRLTNFSTGRLGSELISFLTDRGHTGTLLIGQQATFRGQRRARHVQTFTTTADLHRRLQALSAENIDAVFHAAAVSDFTFGQVWQRSARGEMKEIKSGKIPTRADGLLVELLPTPKVISELRGWFPQARLVGWKYEIEGDRAAVVAAAEKQMAENRTDACVANGRAYGDGFGLVTGGRRCEHFDRMETLFFALEKLIRDTKRKA